LSAYKRHKRKNEAVDDACMRAMRAESAARSSANDDDAHSATIVPLHGAFTASKGPDVDARDRLLANMQLVERAMEAIVDADPMKIVTLSKRHSELVSELVSVSSGAPAGAENGADPFAFLGDSARRPAPSPRKSS
jgi:hypothetical protein